MEQEVLSPPGPSPESDQVAETGVAGVTLEKKGWVHEPENNKVNCMNVVLEIKEIKMFQEMDCAEYRNNNRLIKIVYAFII